MNISASNGEIYLPSEAPPSDSDFCPSSFEQLEPVQKSLYEYLSNCGDWVDEMLIAVSIDLPMPLARKHLQSLAEEWIESNDKEQWRSLSPSYPRENDWDDALPRPELIVIDPEFKSLIPPLSSEERAQLEENLLKEGCRDPLIVWRGDNILLDGHNRFSICNQHDIPFYTVGIDLKDRQAAIFWIITNQLGRRNLNNYAISYFRGRLYNQLKQQGKRNDLTLGKNFTKLDSATKIAAQYKVTERTIKNDAQFSSSIDTLVDLLGKELRPSILSRETKLTKTQTKELADLAKSHPEVVKETFSSASSSKKGKDIIEQIKRKTRKQMSSPFPFQIGEVVWFQANGEASLRAYNGFWGVVNKIYDSYQCDVLLWSGTIKVRPENLKSANIASTDWDKSIAIVERLNMLQADSNEPALLAVIQSLCRRPVTELNSFEEQILSLAMAKEKSVQNEVKHLDALDTTQPQESDTNNSAVGEKAISLVQNPSDAEEVIRALVSEYPDVIEKVLSSDKRF